MRLTVEIEKWPLKVPVPVRITGYTFFELELVVASVSSDGRTGRSLTAMWFIDMTTWLSGGRWLRCHGAPAFAAG